MMLDHLGEPELCAAVLGAVESVIAEGKVRTRDLGGSATTRQMGQAIIAVLRKPGRRAEPLVIRARSSGSSSVQEPDCEWQTDRQQHEQIQRSHDAPSRQKSLVGI